MDWKKLAVSIAAAVAVFAVLWFFGAMLSAKTIYAILAAAVGYLVYAKVAWWELEKAKQQALDAAAKVTGKT